MNAPAFCCFALSPVCGMVNVSPPSGATDFCEASRVGTGTSGPFHIGMVVQVGDVPRPLTIIAALPATNRASTSACAQVTTLFDAEPALTRSVTSYTAPARFPGFFRLGLVAAVAPHERQELPRDPS